MTSAGDDSARVKGYEDKGVTRRQGRRPADRTRAPEVEAPRFSAEQILITTGSDPVIPPIEGLAEAGYWTNREATALHEIPASAVILGGGPVGIELAQFLRRFGSEVTLVQGAPRLVPREDVRVCELLTDSAARGRDRRPPRRPGESPFAATATSASSPSRTARSCTASS